MSAADNLSIVFSAWPKGWVDDACFAHELRAVDVPREGQLLVRTQVLSVDPYMRGRMSMAKSYIPPFVIGKPIESGGIGEVLRSESPHFAVGDVVVGMLPWQAQGIAAANSVRKVTPGAPLTAQLGVLGMPGLTAYVGLLDIGKPKAGETVFVSGAAGAVGSVVGQVAKLQGCRVVGSAGSDSKVRYLLEELGFDAAFNYKTAADQRKALKELCPAGIDVYFDNVGGDTLEAVIWNLNDHARVPLCGMISMYNDAELPPGPRNLMELVRRRVRMEGFIVTDHAKRNPDFMRDMLGWLEAGKVKHTETFFEGLAQAPRALIGLLRGENVGKMLVRVAPSAGH